MRYCLEQWAPLICCSYLAAILRNKEFKLQTINIGTFLERLKSTTSEDLYNQNSLFATKGVGGSGGQNQGRVPEGQESEHTTVSEVLLEKEARDLISLSPAEVYHDPLPRDAEVPSGHILEMQVGFKRHEGGRGGSRLVRKVGVLVAEYQLQRLLCIALLYSHMGTE